MNRDESRRSFLEKVGVLTSGLMGVPYLSNAGSRSVEVLKHQSDNREYEAIDRINIGIIGAGIMGQNDVEAALENSGTELVAACDLYDSRLERCKERWGDELFTTKDYRELLNRDEVDSVIIATPDHWHDRIAIDALQAGKAVYLEKPMIQKIDQGLDVIQAERETDGLLQVGSQSTSALLNSKARELYRKGEIGDLVFVEAHWDRQGAFGAWNYSIPPSAGPENIDWDTYLKDLPQMPFSAEKFFRWRKYRNFGTGVAGDLFVHHFSALHFIIDSLGPERIYGTGGIRFWEDGREVPDFMLATFDYPATDTHPAFNLSLRVNFADGSGGGYFTRLVGTKGELVFEGGELTLRKVPLPDAPEMSIDTFDEQVRKEFEEYHRERYGDSTRNIAEEKTYRSSGDGLGRTALHHKTLFDAMRHGDEIVQDGTFGLRAAAPALAANESYFDGRPFAWDPVNMDAV